MKRILVCGAGGFIGSHLIERLKKEGFWVRGVDLKYPEFSESTADEFVIGDLRDPAVVREVAWSCKGRLTGVVTLVRPRNGRPNTGRTSSWPWDSCGRVNSRRSTR